MLWGFVLGVAALYAYDHYFHTPHMNTGKYSKGGGGG